jgi:outer membrane protein OmpA-like peptidoglycan-associated protein
LFGLLFCPSWASAQGSGSSTQSQSQPASEETRPATTTTFGDTGLWFVPTGEVLPKGRWSFSGYRTNEDRFESYSDISNFRGTFAFGATDRVEVFGNVDFQRRIDADFRPSPRGNGTPMDDPRIFQQWGTGFGDIRVGAKFNVLAPWRQQPLAFAIRPTIKFPTADKNEGLGTGKVDIMLDAVVSGEAANKVELSGYGGFIFRGDPTDFDLSNGLRWGFGAGFPSRAGLRVTTELVGEKYFDDQITYTGPIVSGLPIPSWSVKSPADFILGVTYQNRNGFFVGYGLSYSFTSTGDVVDANYEGGDHGFGDAWGHQVRIGYHPGVRVYVAPPPPAPPAPPPAPAAPVNRPPTVKAQCDPSVVEVGRTCTATANAQDPDGDTLAYKWSAPSGTFANPAERQTIFTCPQTPGAVPLTVTVSDGKGGTASDTVTVQCVAPARKEYTFEDVHFDFDRYSLRPEATRLLDEAVKAMQSDNTLRITVEGHTCNIGTAEYNLALGERRANAVRDYLVSRGIDASRLNTVSYGEERPKHDNSREETRRLNRRAALTVRLQ